MNRREFLHNSLWALGALPWAGQTRGWGQEPAAAATPTASTQRPNIIVILADDLGYGDVSCYGATKVRTPHIDRLAQEGIRCTDAHTPSPICTPTRYSLLTGEYYWRIGPTRGAYWNKKRKALITEEQVTLPGLLKTAGYDTACIGKWHLGFGGEEGPNWNGLLKPGPLEAGFDYFFGVPNANSEAPFAFAENHQLVGLDQSDPIGIPGEKNGDYSQMTGGEMARWRDEDIATIQTQKACKYIETHQDGPFFLYFAPCNVHVPLTPHERFQGSSECGVYGDFIHELDWSVGEVLDTLERLGLSDNTMVVFSSDNGAVVHREPHHHGHLANGIYNGQKTDIWEGGQRVPFIARWPKHIPAGGCTDDLISVSDLMATFAGLLGLPLPDNAAPDSFNILSSLLDQPNHQPGRDTLVMAWPGWALREGPWLYISHQGSGGVTTDPKNKAGVDWMNLAELGKPHSDYDADGKIKPDAPPGQLYNLAEDPSETTNLYRKYPDRVKKMHAQLQAIKRNPVSRNMP